MSEPRTRASTGVRVKFTEDMIHKESLLRAASLGRNSQRAEKHPQAETLLATKRQAGKDDATGYRPEVETERSWSSEGVWAASPRSSRCACAMAEKTSLGLQG